MAVNLGDVNLNMGEMNVENMVFPLEQWFMDQPIVTRYYLSAIALTSILVQCKAVSPYSLFYSAKTVFKKQQYWRLFSSFFYFGPISLDLVFQLFFLQRYFRLIEESSGRSAAKFSWMLFFVAATLVSIASFFDMPFLASPMSSVMSYVWSRRNPDAFISLFGLFTFRAPFLPLVLMAWTWTIHGQIPRDEICGMIVGHVWYFFNDIYPPTNNGHRPLDPPQWWSSMFEMPPQEPIPDDMVAGWEEDTGNQIHPPPPRNI